MDSAQIDLFEEQFGGPEQHPELVLQYLLGGHVDRVESSSAWEQFKDQVLEFTITQRGMATSTPVQPRRHREEMSPGYGHRKKLRITAEEFLHLCALFRFHGMI